MKATEDLPGPRTDVASPMLFQASALPVVNNMATVAVPTTGSACAAPGKSLDPHQEEQNMANPDTDINPDSKTEKDPISKTDL